VLGELPRTATGKIDRKALPAPSDDAYRRAAYAAPATPTEARIAAIWAEVLGASGPAAGSGQLGRHDDFFAVGGHSLLAVRVISRLRAAFGVELPLRTLFEAKTIARLAREVDRRLAQGGARPSLPLVPLSPEERAGALALSSAQQRLWFLDQLDPDSRAYNMSWPHRLRGRLDFQALRRALEALVARHEALRTVFPATGGVPRQDVLPPGRLELPVDDLTALCPGPRAQEAARRAEAAMLDRFDLARGPLLRARMLRLASDDHVLLLELHHVVADGWSLGVLWRELAALYSGLLDGRPPPLAPLPVQYVDYAAWLARWLTGETLDRQVAYWTQQLADPPVDLPLPYRETATPGTAGPAGAAGNRAARTSYRGARIDVALDAELTHRLHAVARDHGVTLFMVLSAALRVLLARITGRRDLCIGTVIANRTDSADWTSTERNQITDDLQSVAKSALTKLTA